jgi:hypothetical protein
MDTFEAEDDLAAVQEAIHDMDDGDKGIPFEEFDRDFRARHDIPAFQPNHEPQRSNSR